VAAIAATRSASPVLRVDARPPPIADGHLALPRQIAHDSCVSSQPHSLTSPRAARRRPRRPPRRLAADLYEWAEYARREPLWAPPGEGADGSRRRRPGRPAKLNHQVVGKVLMAVRAGNFRETAARFAGIGPATLFRWLRDPRPQYVAFQAALDMVDAECEVELVGNLFRLSRTSTRAAIFLLERRYCDRWAPPSRTGPVAPGDTPTPPPSPEYIDARKFLTAELVASLMARATAPTSGDKEF
jgi:hypothetical protein